MYLTRSTTNIPTTQSAARGRHRTESGTVGGRRVAAGVLAAGVAVGLTLTAAGPASAIPLPKVLHGATAR